MSRVDPALDPERVFALAGRLGLSPRQLLALAGRIAAVPDAEIDAARLDSEVACVRGAGGASDAAADLALLGYAAYALDDIDRGLGIMWSSSRTRSD